MTEDSRTTESLLSRRALAEKATPGPWKSVYDYCVLPNIYDDRPANVLIADCSREHDHDKKTKANALYIAANSPDVVMADIDEIVRLRKALAFACYLLTLVCQRHHCADCFLRRKGLCPKYANEELIEIELESVFQADWNRFLRARDA